jgi:hypothetical protein
MAFFIAAAISALAFVALAIGIVRQWYRTDVFQYRRWNPATMRFTVAEATFGGGGIRAHAESATALPTDNLSKVRAIVGSSNSQLTHTRWPGSPELWDRPVLWGDHYRCTPSIGVNMNGLADCWTLEFRFDAAMALLAIFPALWTIARVRRAMSARWPSTSGFPIITPGSERTRDDPDSLRGVQEASGSSLRSEPGVVG